MIESPEWELSIGCQRAPTLTKGFENPRSDCKIPVLFKICYLKIPINKYQTEGFNTEVWPDAKLIEMIIQKAPYKTDLFTIDAQPYLYLETNKIPPIPRNFYYDTMWSFYKTSYDIYKEFC